ncbi:MAG: tail fiber domain-containing protein [Ruminococcaceae bacterium]|nr:tail fiber domain-containing protein [Oscillospiraceae bacterium]
MRAQAQYTIHTLNDVVTGTTAPASPYKGQLWVNTSYSPPRTFVYSGSAWKEQNGTDTLRSNISTLTTKSNTMQSNLDGLTSTVSVLTQTVNETTSDVTTLTSTVSTLQQTATQISASVATKADKSHGDSSTFGWELTDSDFTIYSNGTAVLTVDSGGMTLAGHIDATSGTLSEMRITGRLYFGGDDSGGYFIDPNYNDNSYYIYLPGLRIDEASGAVFTGKLSAPSGTIGGFTIATTKLYKTKTTYSSSTAGVYLGTDGIGLGAGTFYVTSAGAITAKSGTIGAWTLSANNLSSASTTASFYIDSATNTGSYWLRAYTIANSTSTLQFSVSKAGALFANNADITGEINATSGTMTNLVIKGSIYFNDDKTYYMNPNLNNGSWYIYLPKFRVDDTSAYFSGTLQAPAGTIGGFTISTTKLYKTKTAYNNSTSGVYLGTDGIGLGAGTFYVTSAGYLYATSGKIGGMSLTSSQMYSDNFILGTVYNSEDSSQSFTTLSFGTTSGTTFTATTVLTNSGCFMQSLSSNLISCGVIRVQSIRADSSISSTTGFYFGYSGGSTQYYAELSWSGQIIYLKIYNSSGVQTALTAAKTFTVHYACIWGGDTTWNATVAKGASSTSVDTNAFWGIDYATFNYSSSNKAQHTYYFTVSGTSASTTITSYGHIVPWSNNGYDLGSAAYKWRNIYGQAGVVNTSDRNEKKNILPLGGVYDTIFDSLVPVTFKFIDNTSDRTHIGLVAQDVKDAVIAAGITTKDFAGYCEWENDDKTIGCGLRYGEFVAMNIHQIQILKARISELEEKLNTLEEQRNET